MYTIKFTDDALANVKALPKGVRNALKKELQKRLARSPKQHSYELEGPLAGWRSFRWRKYRIVFKIFEDIQAIGVAGVGERLPSSKSDIYRRLEALAAQGKLAQKILANLGQFSSKR